MRRLLSREARDAAWRTAAARENGELVPGKSSLRGVRFPHGASTIVLDQYTVSTGNSSSTYTRLRALVRANSDFRFGFYRENFITRVGKFLGMRDVTTGNPLLDRDYLVRTNQEARVRQLVSGSHLSELLAQVKSGRLELVKFRGKWGKRPEGVAELRWLTGGVVQDPNTLVFLVKILREALDRLHVICAASDRPVDFEL